MADRASSLPTAQQKVWLSTGFGLRNVFLLFFVVSCIFDPADKVVGLKIFLFCTCSLLCVFAGEISKTKFFLPKGLLVYVILFVSIPLLSIANYMIANGWAEPYMGFEMIKAYLFVTFALVLVIGRVDLLPLLSGVLTILALTIIVIFLLLQIDPQLFTLLSTFGKTTGVIIPDVRDYGANVSLLQVYFVTSPMLVISITYYITQAYSRLAKSASSCMWFLAIVNIMGLFLAGTRNNIIMSICLPMVLWIMVKKNRGIRLLLVIVGLLLGAAIFSNELSAFFNPAEKSNGLKLALFSDYVSLLSEQHTLLFGQGLGAYEYFLSKAKYDFVTELTYLEMIRNFGIVGAVIMLLLLLYPLWFSLIKQSSYAWRALGMGYVSYLVMCATNPNLFCSMGIMIISVILAKIYLYKSNVSVSLVYGAKK